MITIIDYQMGNVGSIGNMIAKVGGTATITSDPDRLRAAKKLVLPGVGHFDRGMANLESLGLIPVLRECVIDKRVPVLGICLGMQLLGRASEEGTRPGLGWIDAESKRFDMSARPHLKVPHMGWNEVRPVRESAWFEKEPKETQRFYFVHSYFVSCDRPDDVLARTPYGESFCSAVLHDNICGVQFHPEKSHAFGMDLFRRFVAM